jgi:hypothetical protein
MARLSPPSFKDALLTTAPWALALGFALGAHAGWFCPGHQHAPSVSIFEEEIDLLEDDDPCPREGQELTDLAEQIEQVAETHTVPKELVIALSDDPSLLGEHASAELVVRDGQARGFRISGTDDLMHALGFRDGDLVTSIAGHKLRGPEDLAKVASLVRGYAQVRVMLERDGVEIRKRFFIR